VSESNCMNELPNKVVSYAARPCGMEAVNELQHQTQVNLIAGLLAWVSVPSNTTPNIRSRPGSSRGGSGSTLLNLTPRDLYRSTVSLPQAWGRAGAGNDNCPKSIEKSDHSIVVMKPGNAGGAKGVTS
jgi:hypothetical protein